MSQASTLVQQFHAMVNERAHVDLFYREASLYFDPITYHYWTGKVASGSNGSSGSGKLWNSHLYSGVGIVSLNRMTNFLQGNATPSTGKWLDLTHTNSETLDAEGAKFFKDITRSMEADLRGSALMPSSFYQAMRTVYRNMGISFGALWVYNKKRRGFETGEVVYKAVPSHDFYYQLDEFGRMKACAWRRMMTDIEAMSVIGKEVNEHQSDYERAARSSERKAIIQMVMFDDDKPDNPKHKKEYKFQEYWIDLDENKIIHEDAYQEQPFHVFGWHAVPHSNYFVGPAYEALPDTTSANAARRFQISAMAWAGMPPLLGGQPIENARKSLQPGKLTWGAIDARGNQKIQPMQSGQNPAPLFQQVQDDEARVRSLMGNDELLSSTRPNATATEANIIAQERAAMVAPFAVSVVPQIKAMMVRHIMIKSRAGLLPPVPDSVAQAGGDLDIAIVGPLALASRAARAASTIQAVEQGIFIEQQETKYLDKEEALTQIYEATGNMHLLRDFVEVKEEMKAEAEQQQRAVEAQLAQEETAATAGAIDTAALAGQVISEGDQL